MQAHEFPPVPSAVGMRVDVGTLWTLERHSHLASCTLIWLPRAWEVRIVIDDEPLLSKRCRRQDEVVLTAQGWRRSLRECGWVDAA
ncbi:MAG: hypothetical protein ABIX28_18855 [Vicinamibacterales bacterium]